MKKNAPNEIYTLEDLRDWPKAMRGIKPPVRLAVVGDPVAHSLSPEMHTAALHECGIDMQYARLQISEAELEEAFELFRRNEFVGFNVTLPHKQRGSAIVDEMDPDASAIGAVNTVAIRDHRLVGFNTDGIGFSRAVRDEFSVDLRDLRVLVLGAGGAARAIAFECGKLNCERLVVANRTRVRAQELVQRLQHFFAGPRVLGPVARLQAIGLDESELRGQIAHTDLIVNATSLGLRHSDRVPVPPHLLAPHLMILDTVYLPRRTPLVVAAAEMGARACNGMSMLLHQGTQAFEIWFGREAPVGVMRTSLKTALAG